MTLVKLVTTIEDEYLTTYFDDRKKLLNKFGNDHNIIIQYSNGLNNLGAPLAILTLS